MEPWIILVAIAVLSDATSTYTDNYITDVYFKDRLAMAQKVFHGFAFILVSVLFLFFSGVNFAELASTAVGVLIIAGLINGLSDIPYYKAIETSNVTEVGIFFQLSPVFYLIAGFLFLHEEITILQFVAFFIILAAPIIIILSTRKRSRKIKFKAAMYIALYLLIDVVTNLVFLATEDTSLDIYQSIAFMLLGKGISSVLVTICWPKARRRWKSVMKSSKGKVLRPLTLDFVLVLAYDVSYRLALASAPVVALASAACDAAAPIVLFFLGLLFTLLWPKFGREDMRRKTILAHLTATVLVVVGIVLLQF